MKNLLFILLVVLSFTGLSQTPKQLTNGAPAYIPNYLILEGSLYFYDGSDYIPIRFSGDTISVDSTFKANAIYINSIGDFGEDVIIRDSTVRQLIDEHGGSSPWTAYGDSIEFEGKTITDTLTADEAIGIGTRHPLAAVHINKGVGSLETGVVFGDGNSGFYEYADNGIAIKLNDVVSALWSVNDIQSKDNLPLSTNTYDLGSTGRLWVETWTNEINNPTNIDVEINTVQTVDFTEDTTFVKNYLKAEGGSNISGGGFEQDVNGNLIAGTNAGASLTTGTYNMLIGENAGNALTSSSNNILMGFGAGDALTLSGGNVMIGRDAGTNNVGGINVFLGYEAGFSATSVDNSINIGYKSGYSNTDKDGIAYIGYEAGMNTTGVGNTFLGYRAGKGVITGEKNVVMGYGASNSGVADMDFSVIIGYSAGVTAGDHNVFIGYETGLLTTSNNNVFIGSNSGRATTTGASNTFIGYNTGALNITGFYNTFLGHNAGYKNTQNGNTFLGYYSGYNNTGGYDNIFIGFETGLSNTTGNQNLFAGHQAGYSNLIGTNNVYLGYQAGYSSTGSENINIGFESGFSNTATGNIFIGYESGELNTAGTGNIFIGYESGTTNTTSGNNTALGYEALEFSTGQSNTALGYEAGTNNALGTFNVFIGRGAGLNNGNGDNNVYSGYNAGAGSANESNNVFLGHLAGSSATSSNSIFIGKEAGKNATEDDALYISNSDTINPLIYGNFSTKELIFNADTVEVTGAIKGVVNVAKAQVLYTNTTQTTIVILPTDAIINNIGVEVRTLFDDSGTDYILVGVGSDNDRYIDNTEFEVNTILFYDQMNWGAFSNTPDRMNGSTNITFQYVGQNSNATQGEAYVYIYYTIF
jgi:hypothetical protein